MKPTLTTLLLLASLSASAQVDTASVYYQALQYYENQLSDLPNDKSGEIFIEEELGITEKFPDRIGSRRITVMKWDNKEQVYARNGNKLMHLKMFAAEITGDLIEVNNVTVTNEDSKLIVTVVYTVRRTQQPQVAQFLH